MISINTNIEKKRTEIKGKQRTERGRGGKSKQRRVRGRVSEQRTEKGQEKRIKNW